MSDWITKNMSIIKVRSLSFLDTTKAHFPNATISQNSAGHLKKLIIRFDDDATSLY